MHAHLPLPYSRHSRRRTHRPGAGRRHPTDPALATGTARAAEPERRDRLLLDLASDALDQPVGTILVAGADHAATALEPPSGEALGIIGFVCPPGTAAVATSAPCETRWPDGTGRSGVVAWSASRQGDSLALFREHSTGGVEALSSVAGTLLDAALRALGRPTPPCPVPAVHFPDGVFVRQAERLLTRRDGLCTRRRPGWDQLSLLHPLNGSGRPVSTRLLHGLRQAFHVRHTWSSLREEFVGQPASEPEILPGLTPQVAGWLDDASFARWVLSRISDVADGLERLTGQVDQDTAHALRVALGPLHGASETAR